jgi:hypothetical protein
MTLWKGELPIVAIVRVLIESCPAALRGGHITQLLVKQLLDALRVAIREHFLICVEPSAQQG